MPGHIVIFLNFYYSNIIDGIIKMNSFAISSKGMFSKVKPQIVKNRNNT